MAKSDFGRRLKEVFDNATNQEIARKIGVSPPAVQNYVNGRIPDGEKLILISSITKCNLHWLLTGQGDKYVVPTTGFDLEYVIDQHDNWLDVMQEWYEFEGETMPETMGASFMGGWKSFDKREKAEALRDFKRFLDLIKNDPDD